MVPAFQEFLTPILQHMTDGKNYSIKELQQFCIEEFKLTEEEIAEKIKSGNSRLYDRVQWTMSYFYNALLVDRVKRGIYVITPEGQELANLGIKITVKYLKENYPSFLAFTQGTSRTENEPNASLTAQNNSDEPKTPLDYIDENYQLINKELAKEILHQVKQQSPKFFENLVVDLLVKMGYGGQFDNNAFVTQYSHDQGVDGIIKEDKLGLDKIYVQAKRWDTTTVGRPDIQSFVGALSGLGASKGVFITTSSFSSDARDFRPQNNIKIVLIDGIELAQYMIEYNIGVYVKTTYDIKHIDSDYFEDM